MSPQPNTVSLHSFAPQSRCPARRRGSEQHQGLRRHLSITQEDLAAALHVNQPAVSKLERADDMSLSRLRKAVEALGGELEVGVRIDGVLFPLQLIERESA